MKNVLIILLLLGLAVQTYGDRRGILLSKKPVAAGGGGGGTEPDDVASLIIWLKADALSGSDGDQITPWVDSSVNGHNFYQVTASKRGTFTNSTSFFNNKPSVYFDGTDDFLTNLTYATESANYTVIAVYKPVLKHSDFSEDNLLESLDGDLSFKTVEQATAYKMAMRDRSVANLAEVLEAVPYVLSWVCNSTGSGMQMYTNGVAAGPAGTYTQANSSGTFLLGTGASLAGFLKGTLAEIVVYNTAISTGDRQALENYCGTKYGITITH